MSKAEGEITFGLDYHPIEIRHRTGAWFMVEAVLCHHEAGNEPESWRMRVWGPVPYNPARRDAFVMIATDTSQRPWWSIAPGPNQCPCGPG